MHRVPSSILKQGGIRIAVDEILRWRVVSTYGLANGDAGFSVLHAGVALRHQHAVLVCLVLACLCGYLFELDSRSSGDGDRMRGTQVAGPGRRSGSRTDTAPTAFDFARLSYAEGLALANEKITARLRLISEPMHGDNLTTLYSCQSEDRVSRSVSFAPDQAPGLSARHEELTVEGRLDVRFHDSWKVDGQVIPGRVELRIVDAEIITPRNVELH